MHSILLGFTGGSVVAAADAEVGAAEVDDGATVCDGCTCCDCEGDTDCSTAAVVDVGAGADALGAGITVVLPRPEAPVNTTTACSQKTFNNYPAKSRGIA